MKRKNENKNSVVIRESITFVNSHSILILMFWQFQPSAPHLEESDEYSMISYKVSDMKVDREKHPKTHVG